MTVTSSSTPSQTVSEAQKKLFLIDAYALIYRSYYALIRAPRINSRGLNTSAIMGFCNTLNEIMTKQNPTHLAVAFDHGKTFRHEVYPEYKAQREETPEDIRLSIPYIKKILEAFRIPTLQVDGFEADDVIGTVAGMGEKEGAMVYMLTPDKDYAQLVTDHIHMYRPRHGGGYEDMGPKEVCEKYGIESTSQVIDLLGLMGDSSDNYMGCPGVGEKTAVKLILEFGDIDGLLNNTEKLKGKMKEKVETAKEDIRLSKYLATIRQDVPVDIALDDMTVQKPDTAKLEEIFAELEFKSFADKILGKKTENVKKPVQKQKVVNQQLDLFATYTPDVQEASELSFFDDVRTSDVTVHTIEKEGDIISLCNRLEHVEEYAISIETSDFDIFEPKLQGISFATSEKEAWHVKLTSTLPDHEKNLSLLRPLLESAQKTKIVQNVKYAVEILKSVNINLSLPFFDTMVAHYLINPDLHHNKEYVGVKFRAEQAAEIFAQKKNLVQKMEEAGMMKLFNEVEMPLIPVLVEMEMNGVMLDTEELKKVNSQMNERIQKLEHEIYELAGESFNIASPKQVGDILFGKLQIMEKPKKTKTGQYVTSEEVLNALRSKSPIVDKILEHRGLKKLVGTYIEALPKLINAKTGHLHTTFNQCVTATGRLSSSDPNLQNIPVRSEDGKEIRRCFIADKSAEGDDGINEKWFSADYSQVELRIMASLSGDEHMIEAFNSGQDIHAATAAKILHKPIEEITKDERRKAKSANFGIIYGISAFGLAQDLGIDRKEAKELIDGYFESFPKVMDFIEQCKAQARESGYAVTLMGRRRYLPDINSKNGTVRAFAERNAVNAPIQGTAADIMKLAMVKVYQRIKENGMKAKMLLQVHDELNFSVPPAEREQLERIVIEEMQNAYHMAVALTADGGWGNNWLEAH